MIGRKKMKREETEGHAPALATEEDVHKLVTKSAIDGYLKIFGWFGAVASVVGLAFAITTGLGEPFTIWTLLTLFFSSGLLITILIAVYYRDSLNKKRLQWFLGSDTEYVYQSMARAIGITRDHFIKRVTIREDGSALNIYAFTVRAINQDVHWVEHQTRLVDHPDPQAAARLTVEAESVHATGYEVTVKPREVHGHMALFALHFDPTIVPGKESRVEGFTTVSPPKTYALCQQDLRSGIPYDWSSVAAQYPSSKLTIELKFPKGWFPDGTAKAIVWLGDAKLPHAKEQLRLDGLHCFTHDSRVPGITVLRLEVPYPIPGLKYAITWVPPNRPNKQEATTGDAVPEEAG